MGNLVSLVEKTVTVKVFYEVKDSDLYGGIGSVGYAATEHGGIPFENLDSLTDEFLQETCVDMAMVLKVEPECVRLISKEEYDLNVEDDDIEDEDVEDW